MSHWRNSSFSNAYFIAGKCHSMDEAYRMLCNQKEDRLLAVKLAASSGKKQQAKIIRAKKVILDNLDEADVLDAEAELLELEAHQEQSIACYEAGVYELEFIQALIDKIEPLRKYRHLSDQMAGEAIQAEEWKYELIERTKDYLLTTGTIPADHYRTMRNHPDYKLEIEPFISEVTYLIRSGEVSLVNADRVLELNKPPMQQFLLENNLLNMKLLEGEKE